MDKHNQPEEAERVSDIDWQRLELERTRLKLDAERVALEKAKERTTKLQIGLPLLVTILALLFSAFNERQRSMIEFNKAASSYNEGRYELFKKLTAHTNEGTELKRVYAETFPRDAINLRNELSDTAGNSIRSQTIAAETNYLNQVDGSLTARFHTRLVDVRINAIDRMNICDIVLAHWLACVSVNAHRTIDATIDRNHATHTDNPNLQHFTVHRLSIDPATRNQAACATQQTARINLNKFTS